MTRNGIEYNLRKSPYHVSVNYGDQTYTYFFSSNSYRVKFIERKEQYNDELKSLFFRKFNLDLELELLGDLYCYISIEKRGFLICDTTGNVYDTVSDISIEQKIGG